MAFRGRHILLAKSYNVNLRISINKEYKCYENTHSHRQTVLECGEMLDSYEPQFALFIKPTSRLRKTRTIVILD